MSDYIKHIIEKCHLANPKLLDISEGCRVNTKNGIRIVNYIIQKDKRGDEMVVYCPFRGGVAESDYTSSIKNKVIGHPITLQDILLCFAKAQIQPKYLHGYNDNEFLICLPFTEERKLNCVYDLTKSPYDQSEEVLEFISKNI